MTVSLREGGFYSGDHVFDFVNPSGGIGDKTFTPPSGASDVLKANTDYYVRVEHDSTVLNDFDISVTKSTSQDATGDQEWSIQDNAQLSFNGGSSFLSNVNIMKLSVNGTAVVTVPDAPTNLTWTPGDGRVTLNWEVDDGGSAITKIQYRQKEGFGSFGNWTDIPNSADGGTNATSYTVGSLTNGVAYTFQLQALNNEGTSDASDELATRAGVSQRSTVDSMSGAAYISGHASWPAPVSRRHDRVVERGGLGGGPHSQFSRPAISARWRTGPAIGASPALRRRARPCRFWQTGWG